MRLSWDSIFFMGWGRAQREILFPSWSQKLRLWLMFRGLFCGVTWGIRFFDFWWFDVCWKVIFIECFVLLWKLWAFFWRATESVERHLVVKSRCWSLSKRSLFPGLKYCTKMSAKSVWNFRVMLCGSFKETENKTSNIGKSENKTGQSNTACCAWRHGGGWLLCFSKNRICSQATSTSIHFCIPVAAYKLQVFIFQPTSCQGRAQYHGCLTVSVSGSFCWRLSFFPVDMVLD